MESEISKIPNIENVGFKSGEELSSLILQAKASVYPSIWYENCPLSVMESISLGTPVIGADIGGIPELVENGINGLLFKAGDAEDLVSKISLINDDETFTQKITNACKITVSCQSAYTQKNISR